MCDREASFITYLHRWKPGTLRHRLLSSQYVHILAMFPPNCKNSSRSQLQAERPVDGYHYNGSISRWRQRNDSMEALSPRAAGLLDTIITGTLHVAGQTYSDPLRCSWPVWTMRRQGHYCVRQEVIPQVKVVLVQGDQVMSETTRD